MLTALPLQVREVTGRFLALADKALPGLVEGLYLHGSLGFGEWYDGDSDVDYVAVLAERPDPDTVRVLEKVHAEMAAAPPFDGCHVIWADLAGDPTTAPDVPCTLGGEFAAEWRVDLHPVTWHELATHGVHVRGPGLAELPIWTDQRTLREYTHSNLGSYWAAQADALRQFPDEAGEPEQVKWSVLGVTRLYHLLSTNELTSKCGAGRYALEVFDERWHPVVREALAIRETGRPGPSYPGGETRRGRDTADFVAMVVDEGLAISV